MKDSELISICIASYNSSKYLTRLFDSIYMQKHNNFEVVFIDDGSTDDTHMICEKYKKFFPINYQYQRNSGLSVARQLGIEKSNGKYICFIDSDDFLDEYYLKLMYEKIKEKDADICICGTNMICNNTISLQWKFDKEETIEFEKSELITNYFEYSLKFYMSDSWNKLYKKSFILENKITFNLDVGMRGNDFLFNHKALMYCPNIICITDCLYNHIVREGSMVTTYKKNLQDSFNLIIEKLIIEQNKIFSNSDLINQISILYYNLLLSAELSVFKYNKKKGSEQLFLEMQRKHFLFINQNGIRVSSNKFRYIKFYVYSHLVKKSCMVNRIVLYNRY